VGEVALDRQPAGADGVPRGDELGDRAADERPPALGPAGVGEREGILLAEVDGVGADLVAGERLRRHGHPALDRERQRQPVVVVRVLADQVHAARAAGRDPLSHRGARA
jgi:hypothetical protein